MRIYRVLLKILKVIVTVALFLTVAFLLGLVGAAKMAGKGKH